MSDWMVMFVIRLCDLFRLDYVLSVKRSSGVLTKINASRDDMFMIFGGIVLTYRNTLEAHDEQMLREMLQGMVDKWEATGDFSHKVRERS